MRCCVPFCKNTSDNVSTSEGKKEISFHGFPSDVHLRAAWLRALGKQDSHLPDSAVVCSQHFLNDDFYETESGLRQISTGAIPSTVQVCMICLDTDSKLFLMSKHNLEEAYEKLTGHPSCDQGNLKQTLCVQCAQRLINFSRFRDKSLTARTLMMDLVQKHELITRQHIKMIDRTKHQLKSEMVLTTLGPDHCDLYILEHPPEDKQAELEDTGYTVVKTEESDDSMSVNEDMLLITEDENDVNDFVQDPLKYESAPFQCKLCLEEFVFEHVYTQHMSMHHQIGDGDGECDTPQVCEPHTAVSSSSSHSSLVTENKQTDSSPEAHLKPQTLVGRRPASLATKIEMKASPTEEADSNDSCRYDRLTDCVFKLHDVIIKKVVPRQYESLINTRNDIIRACVSQKIVSNDFNYQSTKEGEVSMTEYVEPVSDITSRVKVIASKTLQSKTDSLNNAIYTHCSNSLQNSSHSEKVFNSTFICDICRKMYKRKNLLVEHIKTHTEKIFCKICQYKCKNQSSLKAHMRTHTDDMHYTCEICKNKFTSKSSLVTHMRTHTGEKPYACKICNNKFTCKSSLVTHMRTHTGEKPYACKICNNKFSRNCHLAAHTRIHTGEKPFTCKICSYKFARNSHLVRHMKTHACEKLYCCKFCEYKGARKVDLDTHMSVHEGEKRFTCEICESEFTKKEGEVSTTESVEPVSDITSRIKVTASKTLQSKTDSLNNAICTHCSNSSQNSSHSEKVFNSTFICDICRKMYKRKNLLVEHVKTHTEKIFCKICQYKCKNQSRLKAHMRTHTDDMHYTCKVCKNKFTCKSSLVTHMRTHTGEKPFCCTVCGSRFSLKINLKSHMTTHTGEKPYACKICNHKFSRNSHLMAHTRIHTGEKPFTCKICSYKFARNSHLVRHMKTHACEKLYRCKLCEYKSALKADLNTHMRIHVGEKRFTCEICEFKFTKKCHLVRHIMRTHQL